MCISIILVIIDWKIDLKDTRLLPFVENLLKVFDWIETDHNLLNCFLYFLNMLCFNPFIKIFIETTDGSKPIFRALFEKILNVSMKKQHTNNELEFLKNGLGLFTNACSFSEVRVLVSNIQYSQVLDSHPQLGQLDSTWDQVACG